MGIRKFIRRYLCCRSDSTQIGPTNEPNQQEEARTETLDLAERNKDSSCPEAKQKDTVIEDTTNVGHDQKDEESASISPIESVTNKQVRGTDID